MRKLDKYFTGSPLKDDVAKLSCPSLSFQKNRTHVNELILNIVIKYLAAYLNIYSNNIQEIRENIRKKIEISRSEDAKFNPYITGQHCDNIYGMSPGVDLYPLNCHTDIKRTAAIFKEIAFNPGFKADSGFRGIDIGCGTGILTLAMQVAAARKNIEDILCVGIEIRERTAKKAGKALKSVLGEKAKVIHADALRDDLMARILQEYQPQYIVSETIDSNPLSGTPKIDIFSPNLGLSVTEDIRKIRSRHSDPFVAVLEQIIKHDKGFIEKIRNGEVAMFPDVINRLFIPDKEDTRIILTTGPNKPLRLYETDTEFRRYEGLGLASLRWTVPSESDEKSAKPEIKKIIRRKNKKQKKPAKSDTAKKQLKLWDDDRL